jgi:thioredoxin-related protein
MTSRLFLSLCLLLSALAPAAGSDGFDDGAIAQVKYPAWFKEAFLDLPQDLTDASEAGKLGLFLFVSTQGCSYCHLFIEKSLGDPAIAERVKTHFDTIGLEIFDDAELTDFAGEPIAVKDFVLSQGVQFAPTLLFYTPDDAGGARLLARLPGYFEPERFNRVLDYLIDRRWETQTLKDYLVATQPSGPAKSDPPPESGAEQAAGGLIQDPLFPPPPHVLDRSRVPAERPLVVIFESADCPRCARFHREVIQDSDLRPQLASIDLVRLDAADDQTPVLTPNGERTTAAAWYRDLGFTDLPALVFVTEQGKNVLQSDALVLKSRMTNSLGFLRERAYERGWNYQRYARSQAMARAAAGEAQH